MRLKLLGAGVLWRVQVDFEAWRCPHLLARREPLGDQFLPRASDPIVGVDQDVARVAPFAGCYHTSWSHGWAKAYSCRLMFALEAHSNPNRGECSGSTHTCGLAGDMLNSL